MKNNLLTGKKTKKGKKKRDVIKEKDLRPHTCSVFWSNYHFSNLYSINRWFQKWKKNNSL